MALLMNTPDQLPRQNGGLGNPISKEFGRMNSKDPTKPLKLTRSIASDQIALTVLDVPDYRVADSAQCFNVLRMHTESLTRFAKTDMGSGGGHGAYGLDLTADATTEPRSTDGSYRRRRVSVKCLPPSPRLRRDESGH